MASLGDVAGAVGKNGRLRLVEALQIFFLFIEGEIWILRERAETRAGHVAQNALELPLPFGTKDRRIARLGMNVGDPHAGDIALDERGAVRVQLASRHLTALFCEQHALAARCGAGVEQILARLHDGANGGRPHRLKGVVSAVKPLVADEVREDEHMRERRILVRAGEVRFLAALETDGHAVALGK